jgi:hypothetical protein
MISGSAALSGSNSTTGSLSYINTIITDAVSSGSYYVVVPNRYMNENMALQLRSVYGYEVSTKTTDLDVNVEYLIKWGTIIPPSPTPTMTMTMTPSITPTMTKTPSMTPTMTVTPSLTPSLTPTMTMTPTIPPPTPTPSATSTHVAGADFTIEWWIKVTNWTSPTFHPRPFSLGAFPAPNAVSIENTGNHIYWWTSGAPHIDYNGLNLQNNQWYHMAITRDNGNLAIYVGGQRVATDTYTNAIPAGANDLWIGAEPNPDSQVNGKMTNFRWNKSVKYTGSSFTVPTSPLTADSNTKLLLLATATGSLTTDSSPLAKTVTNHSATYSSDSPFAGGVGGSINFAGNSYFTIPQSTDWDL